MQYCDICDTLKRNDIQWTISSRKTKGESTVKESKLSQNRRIDAKNRLT